MPRASSAIPAGVAPWREVTGSPMRWKELPAAAVGLEVCQKHQILGDVYGTSLDINRFLVGGWPTPLKNMTSSVGMMKFPIYGKITNVPHHQPVYIYTGCEWNSDGVLVLIFGFLDIKSARVFTICIHMFHCVVLNMVYLFTSAGWRWD